MKCYEYGLAVYLFIVFENEEIQKYPEPFLLYF
jgi:hypothetical protein